jgi:cytochrome c-type biogenesis protein CcmH
MSSHRSARLTALLLAATCLVGAAAVRIEGQTAAKTTAEAIESGIICQCGCNMTVTGCNHEGCSSKAEMQAMAEKEVASGKDSAAILQDFVLRYGTKVLATPPASGFNLTVWILPIVGGFIGLALVVVLVRRWRQAPAGTPGGLAPIDPETMAEVEEEMKRLG